jgi:hypothetical protein
MPEPEYNYSKLLELLIAEFDDEELLDLLSTLAVDLEKPSWINLSTNPKDTEWLEIFRFLDEQNMIPVLLKNAQGKRPTVDFSTINYQNNVIAALQEKVNRARERIKDASSGDELKEAQQDLSEAEHKLRLYLEVNLLKDEVKRALNEWLKDAQIEHDDRIEKYLNAVIKQLGEVPSDEFPDQNYTLKDYRLDLILILRNIQEVLELLRKNTNGLLEKGSKTEEKLDLLIEEQKAIREKFSSAATNIEATKEKLDLLTRLLHLKNRYAKRLK